jgi:hypothetical protein
MHVARIYARPESDAKKQVGECSIGRQGGCESEQGANP